MALSGTGYSVSHISPLPDGVPFSLPILCPIPELAALQSRADIPLQTPAIVSRALPQSVAYANGTYTLTADDGTVLEGTHLVLASSRYASKLLPMLGKTLPLRPVRAHQLSFSGSNLLSKPVAEHLGYGTLAAWVTDTETTLVYDGLADQAQATFSSEPDPRVTSALALWMRSHASNPATVLPEPTVHGWLLATTPDYIPVLGPWVGEPNLWMAVGYAGWGASMALPLANAFVNALNSGSWPANLSLCSPSRFADGSARAVLRPRWLVERAEPSLQPQFASNVRLVGGRTVDVAREVQLVGGVKLERAGTVRTTEKVIQRAGVADVQPNTRPEKGKVRMASVR